MALEGPFWGCLKRFRAILGVETGYKALFSPIAEGSSPIEGDQVAIFTAPDPICIATSRVHIGQNPSLTARSRLNIDPTLLEAGFNPSTDPQNPSKHPQMTPLNPF